MPRGPRLAVAGLPLHIVQRGNNRSACFFEGRDYRYFLHTLLQQADKHCCAVHAYVLMTNHVHLLATPPKPDSISWLMKDLGQRYAQYVNRTYGRSGALWEGRFRSCVVQEETYLLACYRYIELNPVRAGMVPDAAAYPWSSYRANALGEPDPVVTPHDVYAGLALGAKERRSTYRAFFDDVTEDLADDIRKATGGNLALGNDRFRNDIEATLHCRVRPGRRGRPRRPDAANN